MGIDAFERPKKGMDARSGLLTAFRFAEVSVSQHAPYYWPCVLALLIGLVLAICLPELSLMIPRSAGFVR